VAIASARATCDQDSDTTNIRTLQGLMALGDLADSGAATCCKCSEGGNGCFQLLAGGASGAGGGGQLCRSGLVLLGRAGVCSEWLHLAVYATQAGVFGLKTPACVPKAALLELFAQVKKGLESTRQLLGEGSHADKGGQGGGRSGEAEEERGRRRRAAAAAAWEAVATGDSCEMPLGGREAVHSPALQEIVRAGAPLPQGQHGADSSKDPFDLVHEACAALPMMVALRT
jgi:hypothetical protein